MTTTTIARTLFAASLALPLALAASAPAEAAAAKNLKCKGCVGATDLGKKAVKAKHIDNNAVQTKHIKQNAVTSTQIKNGTIQEADLATSARVGDVRQILTGGFNQGAAFANGFTGPGWTTTLSPDYPDTGEGEAAVQIRMPAGTLSNLRVHVQTENVPAGGTLTVMVRVNGADTALSCSVTATGDCTDTGSVNISANDRVALEITTDLNTEGNWTLTYSIQFS